jgi:septal ring factor EnvC (AmiA/AmiB activator)
MRRGVVIGLVVAVIVCVLLAIALATIGTQLDDARLEREDLELTVEDLQDEAETLRAERDTLQTGHQTLKAQVDEQLRTIEQLKVELERSRSQGAMIPMPVSPPPQAESVTQDSGGDVTP